MTMIEYEFEGRKVYSFHINTTTGEPIADVAASLYAPMTRTTTNAAEQLLQRIAPYPNNADCQNPVSWMNGLDTYWVIYNGLTQALTDGTCKFFFPTESPY
jgi:hypothetical protein